MAEEQVGVTVAEMCTPEQVRVLPFELGNGGALSDEEDGCCG